MKVIPIGFPIILATLATTLVPGCSNLLKSPSGEQLFALHCASCHPDGANTIHPSKTLKSADLKANMITTPQDIVQKMRTPGPGMPRFTVAMIPERDALQIARYVLTTFR
jgi:cytochrome c6